MSIRGRLHRFTLGGFARSVALLVGGTALAHTITVLALPLITRLYTPSDFSMLTVFMGAVGIIGAVACLRFDVAIPLPTQEDDAANLLGIALICCAVVSSLLAIVVITVPGHVISALGLPSLRPFLWLLPTGVLFYGSYSALQFWFVRRKQFQYIAEVRVAQSASVVGVQTGCGWLGIGPLGLLIGQVLNGGAGCVAFAYRLARDQEGLFRRMSFGRMRELLSTYDRFPKYSALEALSNSAAIQMPVIMIASLATRPEAGFLGLAMSVMQAPMGLIGGAIAQVYMSRAPEEDRAARLGGFTIGVVGGLLKTGVGPLIFAGIVAPSAFGPIFGDEWRRAGALVSWMTPWFIMQFLATPISTALYVTNHQRAALALQVSGLVVRVGAVFGVYAVAESFISEAYALSGFVFYLAYFLVVLRVVAARPHNLVRQVSKVLPVLLVWTVGGIGIALAINILLLRQS